MLEKNLTERVLLKASESGADFAEIFAEKLRYSSLTAGAGKIDGLSSGLRLGAGIRVLRIISAAMPIQTISAKRD